MHDEDEYCRTGDKVVIRYCGKKISPIKYYYIRNVVLPIGRHYTYDQKDITQYEKEQIAYNEKLRESYNKVYFWKKLQIDTMNSLIILDSIK